jgi:TatA/E family protein of Tat protein translocase
VLPTLALFDSLGFAEMLVIGFVAILVFGGRLPEVMRNLGRGYARFRQGLSEMSRPIRDELAGTTPPPRVEPPPTPLPAATTTADYPAPLPGHAPAPLPPPAAAPASGSPFDEPPPV